MGKITVFLADDHRIFRQGFAELLDKLGGFLLVGEAGNGLEATRKIAEAKPDIVFLDISMPELDGLEAIGKIKSACPKTHILILSMHDKSEYVFRALHKGASAYLLKDTDISEISEAVRAVRSGDTYLSKSVRQVVVKDYIRSSSRGPIGSILDMLSEREKEVFRLVVDGHTGKSAASRLNISPRTVEHHRAIVMKKLACNNVTQLIRLAIREDII